MKFRKDPAKKQKTAQFKEIIADAEKAIKTIEKMADPVKRVKRYEDLNKDLQGHYNGGKPKTFNGYDALPWGIGGSFGGFEVAAAVLMTAAPHIAIPAGLAVIGASAVAGAVGGTRYGGTAYGKSERKKIRAKYGSLGNAHALYTLQEKIKKKAQKDIAKIGPFKYAEIIREQSKADMLPTRKKPETKPIKKIILAAPAETAAPQSLRTIYNARPKPEIERTPVPEPVWAESSLRTVYSRRPRNG